MDARGGQACLRGCLFRADAMNLQTAPGGFSRRGAAAARLILAGAPRITSRATAAPADAVRPRRPSALPAPSGGPDESSRPYQPRRFRPADRLVAAQVADAPRRARAVVGRRAGGRRPANAHRLPAVPIQRARRLEDVQNRRGRLGRVVPRRQRADGRGASGEPPTRPKITLVASRGDAAAFDP